jgi:hypothetical protein
MRLTREAARISALGAGLLLASLVSAAAQDPHTEIFTGLEASNNAITGYLGAGYAFGKTLRARRTAITAMKGYKTPITHGSSFIQFVISRRIADLHNQRTASGPLRLRDRLACL